MNKIIYIILIIILQACSGGNISTISTITTIDDNCSPTKNAKTQLTGFENHTMQPFDLNIINDSILVVYEPLLTDNIINTYNINTLKPLKNFGKIGNGPDDFLLPRYIGDQLYHDNNSFSVGGSDKKIRNFRINGGDTTKIEQTITTLIPDEMRQFNFLLVDNDSVLISSCTGESQLSILDKSKDNIKYVNFHPNFIEAELDPFILNTIVYDALYASNGKTIAISYINWNVIDIVDLNGNLLNRLLFSDYLSNKNEFNLNEKRLFTENAKRYFGKLKVTPNYIFAMNWNDTPKNIRDGKSIPYIYKLDWNGNLVDKYKFDRQIYNFCLRGDDIVYVTASGVDGETYIMNVNLE